MPGTSSTALQNKFIRPIPNILSTFRFLLAVWFPFSHSHEWLWLILAGGASDFLDGWIARRWKVASWQGGLLDAIADKLFVLSVLVTFALAGKFSGWWVPAVIARDIVVTSIALYAICCGLWSSFREMNVSRSGKLATAFQFLLFMVVLLTPEYVTYIIMITTFVSILAALDYGKQFARALKDKYQ